MPHFMAISQLDGRPENRVVVEGHFDGEHDARQQLRYATRQRHGVIALPQDERIEDHGESEIDHLKQKLAALRSELRYAHECEETLLVIKLHSRIEETERAIAHMRKEIDRENSR